MTDLRGQISHSTDVLRALTSTSIEVDKQIPLSVFRQAKAIVFLTQIKAGFIWSGKIGGGIIVSRLPDGRWSAPSSIGTGGMGFGLQVGAQKSDTIITLYDESSIKAFAGKGQLKLGGDVSVSIGPLGRDVAADAGLGDGGFQGSFSYSHSQGLFAGMSVEGAVIAARPKDNESFYGKPVTVNQLLNGEEPPPTDAQSVAFYKALDEVVTRASSK